MAKFYYGIFLTGVVAGEKDQVLATLHELGVYPCYAKLAVRRISAGTAREAKLYGYQTEEQAREKVARLIVAGAMVEMR